MSRPKGSKERPTIIIRATAFDFERFRYLPYMDISSSGESPFVVAARTVKHAQRTACRRARCEFAHS